MSSDFYTNFIAPFAPIIIKICRAYTDTEEDYEDYYQEICLQIWRSKDNFKKQSEWSTWVYRISLNVCLTLLKKAKKDRHLGTANHGLNLSEPNQAFANESLNQLYGAIKTLPEVNRMIILLYLEEKSYQEIAKIIGSNPNNIGVRINRIKNQLKQLLHESVN